MNYETLNILVLIRSMIYFVNASLGFLLTTFYNNHFCSYLKKKVSNDFIQTVLLFFMVDIYYADVTA